MEIAAYGNEIHQNHRLLDSIIHNSYDGIYVSDGQGNGVLVNEAYTRITGVERKELMGKNMADVVKNGIVSESVTFKVLEQKKSVTIVQRVKGKEVLVTGNPVYNDHGEISYIVTNVRDITDLNHTKMELKKQKDSNKKMREQIEVFKKKEGVKLLLDGIVAQSNEIIKAVSLAKKVSEVDSTVILLGESGVGKEVFANMIHMGSHRSQSPYIKVNCGAIPSQLLEAELFGYEKGAFTGADQKGRKGLFEEAENGTIFLDEVGEVPLELQVKLLRVLQEFEVRRVGSALSKKIDVRVIAATNKNLEEMVEKGKFREDLYYRLNIIPITIPPLRERRADIAPLAYFFLSKMNNKYHFNKRFQPEVISIMEQYHWPGNIREMENLIERLAVTSEYEMIEIDSLPARMREATRDEPSTLKAAIENLEKDMIIQSLKEQRTTRKAAEKLGISQSSIVKKMNKLNISKGMF